MPNENKHKHILQFSHLKCTFFDTVHKFLANPSHLLNKILLHCKAPSLSMPKKLLPFLELKSTSLLPPPPILETSSPFPSLGRPPPSQYPMQFLLLLKPTPPMRQWVPCCFGLTLLKTIICLYLRTVLFTRNETGAVDTAMHCAYNGVVLYVHFHVTSFHQSGWGADDDADSIWSTFVAFCAVAAQLASCLGKKFF